MSKLINSIVFCMGLAMLTACHAEQPADLKTWLMQRPLQLRDELTACENHTADPKRCETVSIAVSEMRVLIDEQQKDPQSFGQRILHAEMQKAQTGNDDQIKILLAVVSLNGPE